MIEQRPGTIVFRTTRPLPDHNGLTVAAAWPKGIITPPTSSQVAGHWFEDNLPLIVGCRRHFSDARLFRVRVADGRARSGTGTIIPLFAPPKDMSRRGSLCL